MTEQDLIIYTHWLQQKDAEIERLTAERDALRVALATIKAGAGNPEFVYTTARTAIDAVRNKT